MERKRLYIGIDPSGAKAGNIGVCIAYGVSDVRVMKAVDFFEFMELVMEAAYEYQFNSGEEKPLNPIAVVEDSNINPGAFHRGIKGLRREKQNRDLGKNQFCSFLCIEFLRRQGFLTVAMSPKQKGAKWTEETFRKVSEFKDKMRVKDNHAVDGYSLIYRFMKAPNPEKFAELFKVA